MEDGHKTSFLPGFPGNIQSMLGKVNEGSAGIALFPSLEGHYRNQRKYSEREGEAMSPSIQLLS